MEEAGTKKLILLSHVSASPVSHETFLKEKYEIENLAINSGLEQVVILRTPLVMSGIPGEDRHLDAMLNLFRLPMIYPIPFSKNETFGIVSLDEVVARLKSFIFDESTNSRDVFEISSQKKYAFDEVMKFVCANYIKKQKIGLGTFLGRSVARMIEKLSNKGIISIKRLLKWVFYLKKRGSLSNRVCYFGSCWVR